MSSQRYSDADRDSETSVTLAEVVAEVRELRAENETLREENSQLQERVFELEDRVGQLEASQNATEHAATQAETAAEEAEDAAQAAVDIATKAREAASDVAAIREAADDAKELAEDLQEQTEKRGEIYRDMIAQVNTFESRLDSFEGRLELSTYDSGTTKDRVKRLLIDQLIYKAYQHKQRSRKATAGKGGFACNDVHELTATHRIDISRPYGSQIATELAEEKEFVHRKGGGKRNTGSKTAVTVRFDDLPPALQDRGKELYESNLDGGDL